MIPRDNPGESERDKRLRLRRQRLEEKRQQFLQGENDPDSRSVASWLTEASSPTNVQVRNQIVGGSNYMDTNDRGPGFTPRESMNNSDMIVSSNRNLNNNIDINSMYNDNSSHLPSLPPLPSIGRRQYEDEYVNSVSARNQNNYYNNDDLSASQRLHQRPSQQMIDDYNNDDLSASQRLRQRPSQQIIDDYNNDLSASQRFRQRPSQQIIDDYNNDLSASQRLRQRPSQQMIDDYNNDLSASQRLRQRPSQQMIDDDYNHDLSASQRLRQRPSQQMIDDDYNHDLSASQRFMEFSSPPNQLHGNAQRFVDNPNKADKEYLPQQKHSSTVQVTPPYGTSLDVTSGNSRKKKQLEYGRQLQAQIEEKKRRARQNQQNEVNTGFILGNSRRYGPGYGRKKEQKQSNHAIENNRQQYHENRQDYHREMPNNNNHQGLSYQSRQQQQLQYNQQPNINEEPSVHGLAALNGGLHNEEKYRKKKKAAEYAAELQRQMKEREDRIKRDKKKQEELDKREEEIAKNYDPFTGPKNGRISTRPKKLDTPQDFQPLPTTTQINNEHDKVREEQLSRLSSGSNQKHTRFKTAQMDEQKRNDVAAKKRAQQERQRQLADQIRLKQLKKEEQKRKEEEEDRRLELKIQKELGLEEENNSNVIRKSKSQHSIESYHDVKPSVKINKGSISPPRIERNIEHLYGNSYDDDNSFYEQNAMHIQPHHHQVPIDVRMSRDDGYKLETAARHPSTTEIALQELSQFKQAILSGQHALEQRIKDQERIMLEFQEKLLSKASQLNNNNNNNNSMEAYSRSNHDVDYATNRNSLNRHTYEDNIARSALSSLGDSTLLPRIQIQHTAPLNLTNPTNLPNNQFTASTKSLQNQSSLIREEEYMQFYDGSTKNQPLQPLKCESTFIYPDHPNMGFDPTMTISGNTNMLSEVDSNQIDAHYNEIRSLATSNTFIPTSTTSSYDHSVVNTDIQLPLPPIRSRTPALPTSSKVKEVMDMNDSQYDEASIDRKSVDLSKPQFKQTNDNEIKNNVKDNSIPEIITSGAEPSEISVLTVDSAPINVDSILERNIEKVKQFNMDANDPPSTVNTVSTNMALSPLQNDTTWL